MQAAERSPLRVGIGGPVGSGKTALTLALIESGGDNLAATVIRFVKTEGLLAR